MDKAKKKFMHVELKATKSSSWQHSDYFATIGSV